MNRHHERGQILPIAAVGIVILIGIAGLVMDVGMTWYLLRREQAAVDAASVAAARHIPDGDLAAMRQAACFYARQNDFFKSATTNDLTGTGCVPANDGNGSVLAVHWPPVSLRDDGSAFGTGYVEVALNGSHSTFFARVFGVNSMGVAADAVTGNVETAGGGGQLVALDPTSCRAGQIRGNGNVNVGFNPNTNQWEGTVYVNSDGSTANLATGTAACPATPATLNDQCSGGHGAFSFSGNQARLVTTLVSVRGICGQAANPYPTNCSQPAQPCGLTEGAPDIDDPFNLVTPTRAWAGTPDPAAKTGGISFSLAACDGPTDTGPCTFGGGGGPNNCGTWCELHPGVYYGGWNITTTVCLHPGFYYMAGGAITLTASARLVTLDAGETCSAVAAAGAGNAGGDGRVLIYFTDGPNCPSAPTPTDGRCMGSSNGVFSASGASAGFEARGYEETGTVVRNGVTDDDYHRILIWVSEWKEDGVTRTRHTYPNDTDFNNDKVSMAGNGYFNFWGAIYAPKSLVSLTGNGSGEGNVAGVQIVAWQFDIGGNGTLGMPFDPSELSSIVAKGLVQ